MNSQAITTYLKSRTTEQTSYTVDVLGFTGRWVSDGKVYGNADAADAAAARSARVMGRAARVIETRTYYAHGQHTATRLRQVAVPTMTETEVIAEYV